MTKQKKLEEIIEKAMILSMNKGTVYDQDITQAKKEIIGLLLTEDEMKRAIIPEHITTMTIGTNELCAFLVTKQKERFT